MKEIESQAPVVQMLDSAIQWVNHYPADKYLGNQYLDKYLDRDLSNGWCYLAPFEQLGPGVLLKSDTNTDLVSQFTVQRFSD